MKAIYSARGFSLIEVLVATAISGTILFFGLHGVLSMQKTVSINEARSAKITLSDDLRQQVMNKTTCLSSFVSLPQDLTTMAATVVRPVQIRLSTNEIVGAGSDSKTYANLRTQSLELSSMRQTLSVDSKNYFTGTLTWTGSSQKMETKEASRFAMKPTPVAQVTFETTGTTVLSCFSMDPEFNASYAMQQICEAVGGTFTDGVCRTSLMLGGQCDDSGYVSYNDPNACALKIPRKTGAQVPVSERTNYSWMCPTGFGTDQVTFPAYVRDDCFTTARLLGTAQNRQEYGGRIPAGATCTRPAGINSPGSSSVCLGGRMVLTGYQAALPDPGWSGH